MIRISGISPSRQGFHTDERESSAPARGSNILF
jgi:hypothetical protein